MITVLPNREDSRDFTSGNMSDEVQEDAQEPDSYKCANFSQEANGKVHSEEPNQTEHDQPTSLSGALPLLCLKPTNSYIKNILLDFHSDLVKSSNTG